MLDLNLTVASSDFVSDKLIHLSNSQMESSGSFNSSNVTAGDDSSSNANDAFAYTFGILRPNDVGECLFGAKVQQVEEDDEVDDNSYKRKTIQLFSVMGTVQSLGREGSGAKVIKSAAPPHPAIAYPTILTLHNQDSIHSNFLHLSLKVKLVWCISIALIAIVASV